VQFSVSSVYIVDSGVVVVKTRPMYLNHRNAMSARPGHD